jgi:hypothetical protein
MPVATSAFSDQRRNSYTFAIRHNRTAPLEQ